MTNNKFYYIMCHSIPVSIELEKLVMVMFDVVINFQPEGKLTDTLHKLTKV